jgi:N-acetylmuramoyl-L-alanine amidase
LGIYAYDDLVVLREAHSPAILFEAGVIINPIDEKYIQSDVFKGKVAKAIRTVVQQTKGTHRVGCNPGSARKRKGK